MAYVLGFDEVGKASLPAVGGKNASLGEMLKAGIRVPPGFAITTDSYLDLITAAGIADGVWPVEHVKVDSPCCRGLHRVGHGAGIGIEARAHILEGYRIALANLDQVIAIIRKSKDPEEARVRLTPRGRLLGNQVFMRFV